VDRRTPLALYFFFDQRENLFQSRDLLLGFRQVIFECSAGRFVLRGLWPSGQRCQELALG
jgi:hypothetical protein